MKKLIMIIFVSCCTLVLWACSGGTENNKERLFGFTAMDMTDQSFLLAKGELEEIVVQNGDRLITFDPELDNEKQIQGISDMIAQGIEVLFLNPVDINGILPALEECRKNNVKIICFDSKVADESYIETFVGGDNYKMGYLIGEYMKKDYPQGGRLVYLTNENASSIKRREKGLLDALEGSDITVVATEDIARYEDVLPATEKILEEHGDIDILWGFNDDVSLMMHSCVVAYGLQDQIVIYDTGGNTDIMKALKKGLVKAVAVQSPADWGKVCGELCYRILNGETVKSDYLLEASIVDTESVDDYEEEP